MTNVENPLNLKERIRACAVRCGNVYNNESLLLGFFLNSLPIIIRDEVDRYEMAQQSIGLDELARYGEFYFHRNHGVIN